MMFKDDGEDGVLKEYYPQLARNAEESAHWLRSGAEYEDFFIGRGIKPLTSEQREKLALKYDAMAAFYSAKAAK